MRTIKFRVWDIEEKTMRTFEPYGDAPIMSVNVEGQFILLQYTGLKDKNGTEIYEGDIVQLFEDKFLKIKFCEEYSSFVGEAPGWIFPLNAGLTENYAVISNIYDNSELLETL